MRFGFIGAGKVGCSLGKYLTVNGFSVSGYFSRSSSSAEYAAALTGTECFGDINILAGKSDVILLTVPDKALAGVYNELEKTELGGKLLCHCSGAMTADEVFSGIEKYGASACSVHPLFPVSSRENSYKELGRAYFCLEGSKRGTELWQNVLTKLGNPSRVISADVKSRYHAACSVISNLVCALADESLSLMLSCGFTAKEALSALRPLAENNIKSIFDKDPLSALTGPVERNDTETVKRHLKCMTDPAGREIYIALSKKLVDMAMKRHPDGDYSEMNKLLSEK